MSPASMISSPYMNMGNNMQGQMWEAFRAGVMWAQSQGGMMPPPPGPMPPMNYGHHDPTKLGNDPNVGKNHMV